MYFQDLSEEQLSRVVEMLKVDEDIINPQERKNLSETEISEMVDDWMNRHNSADFVLNCLERAYP